MSHCQVCEATTDGFVCRHCLLELERDIGDMTSLMHEVSVVATRQARVYRASGTAQRPQEPPAEPERPLPAWLRSPDGRIALRPTPMPVDLDAADLLWTAGNTLSTWTRHLAESRGAELPTAEQMIGWLLTNIEAVRWDEAGGVIHEEITGLHHDLERAVDRSPSRLYAGPCQYDGCERDLYAWPNADEIVCDGHRGDGVGCRVTHTWAGRQEWLIASLDDALAPIEEWQTALPRLLPELVWPNRSTWWRWVQPGGRLLAYSQDRVGRPTYRGQDVIALVRAEQARIIGNQSKRRTA